MSTQPKCLPAAYFKKGGKINEQPAQKLFSAQAVLQLMNFLSAYPFVGRKGNITERNLRSTRRPKANVYIFAVGYGEVKVAYRRIGIITDFGSNRLA